MDRGSECQPLCPLLPTTTLLRGSESPQRLGNEGVRLEGMFEVRLLSSVRTAKISSGLVLKLSTQFSVSRSIDLWHENECPYGWNYSCLVSLSFEHTVRLYSHLTESTHLLFTPHTRLKAVKSISKPLRSISFSLTSPTTQPPVLLDQYCCLLRNHIHRPLQVDIR